MELNIDKEFRDLISPLTEVEFTQLKENILAEGCRDPLVVWNGIILDGHNRYAICQSYEVPFEIHEVNLVSRNEAINWIIDNQLGRRNLSPWQMSILRGKRYNAEKNDRGGNRKSSSQNDYLKTNERLAEQYNVSPSTIQRDGNFAKAAEIAAEENNVPIMQLSKAQILEAAKEIQNEKREQKRAEIIQKLESIEAQEVKAIQGIYDVIVIDPPWPMEKIERDVAPNQVAFEYPTMTLEEITRLNIPTADDCHVWLWTTQKFLPDAIELLKSWGLKYVCTFTWHKPGGFQPWGLPQYNSEFALYARKGAPSFVDFKDFKTCFSAPRGAHSEKPQEFYDLVNRVTAGRRLDMFNRRQIIGFDGWGSETP